MIFSKFTRVCRHHHSPILEHFHSPRKAPPATCQLLLQTQKTPLFFVCRDVCLWTYHINTTIQCKYMVFPSGFFNFRIYQYFIPFFPLK